MATAPAIAVSGQHWLALTEDRLLIQVLNEDLDNLNISYFSSENNNIFGCDCTHSRNPVISDIESDNSNDDRKGENVTGKLLTGYV
jgi:hypothetical protein